MPTESNKPTAIIIGAGPSGLATSLSLSRSCSKIYLVEKHHSFDQRGSTFGLAANGQRALKQINHELYEDMEKNGLHTGSNGPNGHGTWVFIWWEMRDILLKHVRQDKNIELLCGQEFTEIQDDKDNGITVKFLSGLELKADFLVASDGVRSDVRKYMNLPPPIISDTTNFRGNFTVPDSASSELKALLDKGIAPFFALGGASLYFVLFNFHQRHSNRMAWILATQLDVQSDETMTPHTIVDEYAQSEEDKKLLHEILNLSSEVHLKPYPKSTIINFSDDTIASLGGGWGGKGRITLVGDCAHGMRPTDGYGGSMALEDAVVLGRMLQNWIEGEHDKSSSHPSLESVLRDFESQRLPRVKRIYDNQFERYDIRMKGGKRLGPQDEEFMAWLLAGV
ncbi:hypothetical protein ACHAXS_001813 [Conticribra weissflogii]